ncbi:MAG: BBE domain-containing protein, partial [Gaiellaceae bacterium]
ERKGLRSDTGVPFPPIPRHDVVDIPAATDENIAWTRETHRAFGPHLDEARWLNYLGDDQFSDAVRAAYGPNYQRLLDVKRRYDPENVFHHNHNIDPN